MEDIKNLKIELYANFHSPMMFLTSPHEYSSFREALSFNGGRVTLNGSSMTVVRADGSSFSTPLANYFDDAMSTTYTGYFETGRPFRITLSTNCGLNKNDSPIITLESVSIISWTIHYMMEKA